MEINDLKGRHLSAIQDHLQSLTEMYPQIAEEQDQMLVRLAMLLHDEDPTDMARADELLNGTASAYMKYALPIIDLNGAIPAATMADDGTYQTVVLPASSRTVTIQPLTGRQWRLAMTDAVRVNRVGAMSGLDVSDCLELNLLDYLTLEAATVPFVSEVLATLTSGGDSSGSSSKQELDSPT